MALVNYDIQKASNTPESTILPVDRYELADDFKRIAQTGRTIAYTISNLSKNYGGGGRSSGSTASKELENAFARDLQELQRIRDTKPDMRESEARMYFDAAFNRPEYNVISPATKFSIAANMGFKYSEDYYTKAANDVAEANAKQLTQERLNLQNLAVEVNPDAADWSPADQERFGREVEQNTIYLAQNAQILGNPVSTPVEIDGALYATKQSMRRNVGFAVKRLIQQDPLITAARLDAVEMRARQDMSAIGVPLAMQNSILNEIMSPYHKLAADNTKSVEQKVKELKNVNDYNTNIFNLTLAGQTGIPSPEIYEKIGNLYPMLDEKGKKLVEQFGTNLATATETVRNNMAGPNEAYNVARLFSRNDSVTPLALNQSIVVATKAITKPINEMTYEDLKNDNVIATANLAKLEQLLQSPNFINSTKDIVTPADKQVFSDIMQDYVNAAIKNSIGITLFNADATFSFSADGTISPTSFWTSDKNARESAARLNQQIARIKDVLSGVIPSEEINGMIARAFTENNLNISAEERQEHREYSKSATEHVNEEINKRDINQALSRTPLNIRVSAEPFESVDEAAGVYGAATPEQKKILRNKVLLTLRERAKKGIIHQIRRSDLPFASPTPYGDFETEPDVANLIANSDGTITVDDVRNLYQAVKTKDYKNPLNIKDNNQNWIGEVGSDGNLVIFDTPDNGIRAGSKLIDTYVSRHGIGTVKDFLNRFAPDTENDTKAYIKTVSSKLGVKPTEFIDLTDNVNKARLLKTLIDVESPSRRNDYTYDDIYRIITTNPVDDLTEETRQLFQLQ